MHRSKYNLRNTLCLDQLFHFSIPFPKFYSICCLNSLKNMSINIVCSSFVKINYRIKAAFGIHFNVQENFIWCAIPSEIKSPLLVMQQRKTIFCYKEVYNKRCCYHSTQIALRNIQQFVLRKNKKNFLSFHCLTFFQKN